MTEKNKRHPIWGDYALDINDWRDYFESTNRTDLSDYEKYNEIFDINRDYLGDESMNLDKKLKGYVIGFATRSVWNGTLSGYAILGRNLNAIFHSVNYDGMDYHEIYGEYGDIFCWGIDHDGTGTAVLRFLPDANINELSDIDDMTSDKIYEITESLYPAVASIYGWTD